MVHSTNRVNDKVYFRVTTISSGVKADYIATIPESNYTLAEFATSVKNKVNLITGLSSGVCTPNNGNNTTFVYIRCFI